MPYCIHIPGTLGTRLYDDDQLESELWVSYRRLSLGQVGKTRLAPDGQSPGPPDGVRLYRYTSLPDYYHTCTSTLSEGLARFGYTVLDFGWDWRKHFFAAGEELAGFIRRNVSVVDPCALVAHSAGGLVARAAWASLSSTGDANRIRRIVTLGTPHQGSYAAVSAWSGQGTGLMRQLTAVSLIGGTLGSTIPFTGAREWSTGELQTLTATWPLLYETLPVLGSADSAQDTARGQVFAKASWVRDPGLSQVWLDRAKDVIGPWLLNPMTMPPSWVLTCLAGKGTPTVAMLATPSSLGRDNALGLTDQGDGQVTVASALGADSVNATADWAHADLPALAASTGWLVPAVLEIRKPPDPPTDTLQLRGQDLLGLYGPPFPQNVGGPSRPGQCGTVPCSC